MQAIIFKIFLLLFLQGGKASMAGNSDGFLIDNIMLAKNMSLQMSGDPMTLEQIISVCTQADIGCEISRQQESIALISFKNLRFDKREQLMKQISAIKKDVELEWNE